MPLITKGVSMIAGFMNILFLSMHNEYSVTKEILHNFVFICFLHKIQALPRYKV